MKLTICALFFLQFLFGQSKTDICPCCTANHQAFDFWVGDWEVFDTTGKKVGENVIVKLQDDCIIQENWKGSGGSAGSSYNYFNKVDSTWNQVWVDTKGNHLILKGEASMHKMILADEFKTSPNPSIKYKNQITWTKQSDDSVEQLWEAIGEDGKVLQEVFRGIYKRRQ